MQRAPLRGRSAGRRLASLPAVRCADSAAARPPSCLPSSPQTTGSRQAQDRRGSLCQGVAEELSLRPCPASPPRRVFAQQRARPCAPQLPHSFVTPPLSTNPFSWLAPYLFAPMPSSAETHGRLPYIPPRFFVLHCFPSPPQPSPFRISSHTCWPRSASVFGTINKRHTSAPASAHAATVIGTRIGRLWMEGHCAEMQ